MRTITIEMTVSTKYVGSEVTSEFSFEVEDDATPQEIEEMANDITREWMHENINWGFEIKSDQTEIEE